MLSTEKPRGFRPQLVDAPEAHPGDGELWARFAGEATGGDFFELWLALQCRQIRSACAALLLFENAEGKTFLPLAVWPERSHDANYLKSVRSEERV
jgi:hypothetical protein